ncbi:MAG: 2TM domain-containing protein [Bacteroidota bacterium]
MTKSIETKRELAKKRVAEYKGFFRHLKVFIFINGLFYLFKTGWLESIMPEGFPQEAYYFDWVDLNVIIWGVILIVHGLTLYRHRLTFLKKWEDRQIRKYMDQDREETKKYR